MILIEDLGMRLANIGSKRPTRYGLYKCPTCHEHFECITNAKRVLVTTQCKSCGGKTAAQPRSMKAAKEFIDKAMAAHGSKYDYSKIIYKHSNEGIQIICSKHGGFYQTPANHLAGNGCPECALYGFNKTKAAILYYLKVVDNDTIVYKIGITNRSVQERFHNSDLAKISILKVWEYPLGVEAWTKEVEILKLYQDYKYTGDPLLSSGNTELFTMDILGLDYDTRY